MGGWGEVVEEGDGRGLREGDREKRSADSHSEQERGAKAHS